MFKGGNVKFEESVKRIGSASIKTKYADIKIRATEENEAWDIKEELIKYLDNILGNIEVRSSAKYEVNEIEKDIWECHVTVGIEDKVEFDVIEKHTQQWAFEKLKALIR